MTHYEQYWPLTPCGDRGSEHAVIQAIWANTVIDTVIAWNNMILAIWANTGLVTLVLWAMLYGLSLYQARPLCQDHHHMAHYASIVLICQDHQYRPCTVRHSQ